LLSESRKRVAVDGGASIPPQLDSSPHSVTISSLLNVGETREESYQNAWW
jgi:hypothetical protein